MSDAAKRWISPYWASFPSGKRRNRVEQRATAARANKIGHAPREARRMHQDDNEESAEKREREGPTLASR